MKNEIRGWKNIFLFTLTQTLKSKAYIVSFAIVLILSLVSLPAISLLSQGEEDADAKNAIEKVYVFNETSLQTLDFTKALNEESISHIKIVMEKEDYDSVLDRIETKENKAVALTVEEDGNGYYLKFVTSTADVVDSSDIQSLEESMGEYFRNYKISVLDMTEEQNAMISAEVETIISETDAGGKAIVEEDTSISDSEYWLIYVLLFVVMMVNVMASTQIATSIVSDKSSKVIEYLLTSVRPLAIIIGKILAVLVAVLIQIIALIGSILLSTLFTSNYLGDDVTSMVSEYVSMGIIDNITPLNIICSLVVVILGFVFYATLAGLCGATVSRMEEASESLTLFTMVNLVGAYVGMGAAGSLMGAGDNAFATFALLFPLSSPFLIPGAILVGKTNVMIISLSIVLLLVAIVLLFLFVARVYETLILHNGNKVGIKELLQISKHSSTKSSTQILGGGAQDE
jgi:ABC-2 type transport system permease protein